MTAATLSILAVLALGSPLQAEDASGRYTMMPAEGGFIRLDTKTGLTSICARKGSEWACDAMPDAQQKMRDEMTRLETENQRLKGEIDQMERTLGLKPDPSTPDANAPMSPDAPPPAPKSQIPSEQDVDRMFDYIEGMVKKFKERIERMEKDPLPPKPGEPAPPGKGTQL
jgi:hypothetical protein